MSNRLRSKNKSIEKLLMSILFGVLGIYLSPSLALSETSSDTRIQEFVENVVEDLVTQLPEGLDAENIRFAEISLEHLNETWGAKAICEGTVTLAKWKDEKNLVLSQKLVEWGLSTESSLANIECSHGSARKIIQGAVVHLLAHRFDDKYNLSDSAKFKDLLGGQKSKLSPWGKGRISNNNLNRSPDPNEFKNLEEAFATNIEYFVLDENFVCLKPALARFFEKHFSMRKSKDCSAHRYLLLHSKHQQDNLLRAVNISPQNVYQVHYLHAAEGPSFSSRWGHSMFRLIMCSPDRKQMGPECLNDISDDIVLSYRARVTDLSINYWSGISGKYPSQLFALSFSEVLRDYTRMEFRDLKSIPLDLSRDEVDEFLDISLERYWNYTGQYFFFTNHCASETARHLKALSPEKSSGVNGRNPRKLFSSVEKSVLNSDNALLEQYASKENSPIFFASKEEMYQNAFAFLKDRRPFKYSTLENFLGDTDDSNRMFVYHSVLENQKDPEIRKRLVNNLLLLERLRNRQQMERIWNLNSNSIEDFSSSDSSSMRPILEKIKALMSEEQGGVKAQSFGIPSKKEIDTFIAHRKSRLLELSRTLNEKESPKEFSMMVALVKDSHSFQDFLLNHFSIQSGK